MELISPGIGLLFWMVLSFTLVIFVLGKFAWKPVLAMIKERENTIENSLRSAEKAQEEMKELVFNNEILKRQALDERDALLNEARVAKSKLIEEARVTAKQEYNRIVEIAKDAIEFEKKAAFTELKNHVANISVSIAEKILEKELSESSKQEDYINKLLDEVNFN